MRLPAERAGVLQRRVRWGERTYVMGIVNVTPDSFSGDGLQRSDEAIAHALAQHAAGSDVIDVGAESTRPSHVPVDEATEIARLIPVIAGVRARLPEALISCDTYKPGVLRAARAAGADMLNSVWGLPDDLLAVAAECGMPVAVMHNKREAVYDGDVMDEVLAMLADAAQRARRAGMARESIVLDPGIGFGKTQEHNLAVLRRLDRLVALGFPTLLGTSRKSLLGKLTGRSPRERVYATVATTALAVAAGVDMVRVHDVAAARDAIAVSDAIVRGWRPAGWT